MTTENLYDVLLIEPDSTAGQIKEAYKTLAPLNHPDKGGDAELFNMITHAYEVLINPKTRASYDKIYHISKQSESSHIDLKSRFKDYNSGRESIDSKKSKEETVIDFDKSFAEMDLKYGFKRDASSKKVIETPIDIVKKKQDLESIRDHDDIENMPEKLFDDNKIDLEKFNSIFDAKHRRQHTDLIPHQGNPIAWNTVSDCTYSSIDNYETLYSENDNNGSGMFGPVRDNSTMPTKISKKDIDRLPKADYVKAHNNKDDNYKKTLDDLIEERNRETQRYKDRTLENFNNDDDCGGYSIFQSLGLEFNDFDTIQAGENLNRNYQKLIESRK